MERVTTSPNASQASHGIFGLLRGASFSSFVRNLSQRQQHSELLHSIRCSMLSDWHIDSSTGTVSLEKGGVSVRFFSNAGAGTPWLTGLTQHGPIECHRGDAFSLRLESRLQRRLRVYGAELAQGISEGWLEQLAHRPTDDGLIWSNGQRESFREWFGEGSHRDVTRAQFTTITPEGLSIAIRRSEAVTFVSLKEAFREDRRYAEQSFELDRYLDRPKLTCFSPFLTYSSNRPPWRPDPPLKYGAHHTVSIRVQVKSTQLEALATSLGLRPEPVASLSIETGS